VNPRQRVNASPEEFLRLKAWSMDVFSSRRKYSRIHYALLKSGLDNNWGGYLYAASLQKK